MPRLSKEKISEIGRLTKEGYSLNTISRSLQIGKTTAYYYFLKIRGKTYSQKSFSIRKQKQLGEIIGIFAGDGSFHFEPKGYHYQIRIHTGIDQDYTNYVKSLYEAAFKKKFRLKKDKNQFILETTSKIIYEHLRKYIDFRLKNKAFTIMLKNKRHSNKFLIGFIRGEFDTDGSIHLTKNGKVTLTFYTISPKLAEQIITGLKKLGIETGVYLADKGKHHKLFHIRVRAKSIQPFLNKIKPFKCRHTSNFKA